MTANRTLVNMYSDFNGRRNASLGNAKQLDVINSIGFVSLSIAVYRNK